MAERFSWVSCIYFTKFKRRRASGFSLYTYIFVYFYAYIQKKICGLLHTFLSAPRQVPPVFFRTLWYDGYKKGLNAKDKEYESGISI